jgi:hypothetical protein
LRLNGFVAIEIVPPKNAVKKTYLNEVLILKSYADVAFVAGTLV